MTEELFRENAYMKTCDATVVGADAQGVILDRTIFYPMGGGQPGDTGALITQDGQRIEITNTVKDKESGSHMHVTAEGAPTLNTGDVITCEIEWDRRYKMMRMHSALHLLCACLEGGVTSGQIGEEKSRLDFDLPDINLDKEAISTQLNSLVEGSYPISHCWITDAEMFENEDMVRTMSVKPPMGAGKVRLIEISDGVDLQPCGGTHVANTSEIGALRVGKIENKGKHNRRVNIHFAAP